MSTRLKNKSESHTNKDLLRDERTITNTLAELFYPTFKRFFEGKDFVNDVEDDLGKANINIPVEIYMSAAIGYGIILGAVLGIFINILGWIGFTSALSPTPFDPEILPYGETVIVSILVGIGNVLQYLTVAILIGVIGAGIGFLVALTTSLYYPTFVKRSRKREIDLLLGDTIGFMYSLSIGGTNQIEVMEAVADSEDTYGEVSVEFQRIIYEMKYFNTDYQTAVENVAQLTPSKELEAFLTDMLSIINSGGDMKSFLDTQQEMMRERGKKKQEEMLDTMEFFGEMYMSLNVLPMGLLVVLVIVSMMGSPQLAGLYMTVYAILPGLNIMFALLVSTVKQDEIGNGKIDPQGDIAAIGEDETRLTQMGVINHYVSGDHGWFFKPIRTREIKYRLKSIFRSPWEFFRIRPPYVLMITVPLTLVIMIGLVLTGIAQPGIDAMVDDPYVQTVMWVYVPVLINCIPLAIFYEWNLRTRGKITDTLTEDIRKLANANETGQPILEAMRMSASGQNTLLAQEFRQMYKKTKFGTNLSPALIEFNNRYRIPRLARVVKLMQKAQEASSNITEVLRTAATTSRYQDDLEADRIQRTRMQVAVTSITFLVFLGVIAMLEVYFLGEMFDGVEFSGDTPATGFQDLQVSLISMLFFHAITVQALFAGAISGYIQTGKIYSSYKYISVYLLISLVVWGALAV